MINSDDITKYVAEFLKYTLSQFIINKLLLTLKIPEKIIFFTFEIKSLDYKEKIIFSKFPKIQFNDLLDKELTESFIFLRLFIEKNIFKKEDIINSIYFKGLISNCNNILERLDKMEINFCEVIKLQEIISKNKLYERIKYLCLGDSFKSSNYEEKIKIYVNKYSQLDKLIRFYNKYFPNSKQNEIEKYNKVLKDLLETKINICEIQINDNILEEIKTFENFENSIFIKIFYNNIDFYNEKNAEKNIENLEVYKFNKSKEYFNKCKSLFNGEKIEISFLGKALIKLNDDIDNLLKEIIYLKKVFKYSEVDEKK